MENDLIDCMFKLIEPNPSQNNNKVMFVNDIPIPNFFIQKNGRP
jgi:hypothetical protein